MTHYCKFARLEELALYNMSHELWTDVSHFSFLDESLIDGMSGSRYTVLKLAGTPYWPHAHVGNSL